MDYPFDSLPEAGATLEVAPGIRWLRMPLPFALDHINLWLVADGEDWTAVDTGICLDPVKDAWRKVLATHRLTRQIVTHFHPDHLGLAAWLEEETSAPLWITLGEYTTAQLILGQVAGYGVPAMVDFFRSHGLDEERLAALDKRGNAYKRGVPTLPMTYRRMHDGESIVIGAHAWRVIVGHGHAPEHASLYCADLGVLISGDMMLPRISTNVSAWSTAPTVDALGQFLASIEALRKLPADTLVLPSHGRPFRGLHERIDQLVAHHDARCDALMTATEGTAKSAAELIPVLFEREIADAHQAMFAMGEAIAHLIHLEQTRSMKRVTVNGIVRFLKQ
jgi:glyoxylase-like metal-dependent hydrolase (beta-lactamase superfamily II)